MVFIILVDAKIRCQFQSIVMLDAELNTENEVASMKMTILGDVGVSVEAAPCVARLHHVRVLCEHTETTWPPPAPLCPGQDAAPCPVSSSSAEHTPALQSSPPAPCSGPAWPRPPCSPPRAQPRPSTSSAPLSAHCAAFVRWCALASLHKEVCERCIRSGGGGVQ